MKEIVLACVFLLCTALDVECAKSPRGTSDSGEAFGAKIYTKETQEAREGAADLDYASDKEILAALIQALEELQLYSDVKNPAGLQRSIEGLKQLYVSMSDGDALVRDSVPPEYAERLVSAIMEEVKMLEAPTSTEAVEGNMARQALDDRASTLTKMIKKRVGLTTGPPQRR